MPAVDAADPTFPIADQKRFAVIAFGTIAEISAGPELPVFEGDPEPIETIVVTVEVIKAFRGEQVPASRIYVRLVGGELESLRKAVPIGTNTVVSVEPVDKSFDEVLIDPQAGVPQGEARYIAGPTYFAVADGPESTWFPLLGITAKQPLDNLVGRADGGDGG